MANNNVVRYIRVREVDKRTWADFKTIAVQNNVSITNLLNSVLRQFVDEAKGSK